MKMLSATFTTTLLSLVYLSSQVVAAPMPLPTTESVADDSPNPATSASSKLSSAFGGMKKGISSVVKSATEKVKSTSGKVIKSANQKVKAAGDKVTGVVDKTRDVLPGGAQSKINAHIKDERSKLESESLSSSTNTKEFYEEHIIKILPDFQRRVKNDLKDLRDAKGTFAAITGAWAFGGAKSKICLLMLT
jgi:hypothetical protein